VSYADDANRTLSENLTNPAKLSTSCRKSQVKQFVRKGGFVRSLVRAMPAGPLECQKLQCVRSNSMRTLLHVVVVLGCAVVLFGMAPSTTAMESDDEQVTVAIAPARRPHLTAAPARVKIRPRWIVGDAVALASSPLSFSVPATRVPDSLSQAGRSTLQSSCLLRC
jgi:hypothetical protein